MAFSGDSLIGGTHVKGGTATFHGNNPATGAPLDPPFSEAGTAEVERACALAAEAFNTYRETSLEARAKFLETIADKITEIGDELIDRACEETGLPQARIKGERARTTDQLRLFASVVRDGLWLDARIDPAQPDRAPMPRVDIRLRNIGIGPVAVFGASNFPLAFSVAGGDTASALAAGCPVVVKAHPAHPGTSALVGKAVQEAVKACGLPEGVFSLLFGAGNELGSALVANPEIKSVGFTGSRNGGVALMKIAAARPEPIPVHSEMSSINPVILFSGALAARSAEIAKGFVGSLAMGAGQFCTNPGLIIAEDGPDLDAFVKAVSEAVKTVPTATMLTSGIAKTYQQGVERLAANPEVKEIVQGQSSGAPNQCQAVFFETSAKDFLADKTLSEEVFGASSLLIRCPDHASIMQVLGALEGQLTVTLQMDDADIESAKRLLPLLERKAGRILANSWPTGVEVCHAMVHGGPFPATSDSRTTSVGTLAIRRFLRPVCYQNLPEALLPEHLKSANVPGIPHMYDGKFLLPG